MRSRGAAISLNEANTSHLSVMRLGRQTTKPVCRGKMRTNCSLNLSFNFHTIKFRLEIKASESIVY